MSGEGVAQQQLGGPHRDGGVSAPMSAIEPVAVIDDAAAAEVSLDPMRARLLAALAEPGSASTLAADTGLARQKINYHLHALERHGLIELVEERKRGNCTERVLRATAASYVISPAALASVAPDPGRSPDQLSARWLLALAARLVREVGELITRSRAAGQPVATFAIDSEIRFGSAAERAEFARELSETIKDLAARYHNESAPGGREHRLVVALHPSITRPAGSPQQPGSTDQPASTPQRQE
jgi:DNA-binding transcriptional ArsR family regulator